MTYRMPEYNERNRPQRSYNRLDVITDLELRPTPGNGSRTLPPELMNELTRVCFRAAMNDEIDIDIFMNGEPRKLIVSMPALLYDGSYHAQARLLIADLQKVKGVTRAYIPTAEPV
jgi:hypothetical protein